MYLVLNIKYIKLLRILFWIIILNTYYLIHTTTTIHAEGISLSASPSLITVDALPPANPKTPITIENKSDNTQNIQIRLLPFHPSKKEDGQIEYLNPNSIPQSYKDIFEKIHLTDNGIITTSFELGPKQKKDLELQFLIFKEEPTADYYFSVIFLTSQKTPNSPPNPCQNTANEIIPPNNNSCLSAYSHLNAGIATNVLLSIGSKDNPQGEILEFSSPKFLQSGPVPFTVRVKNSGPHVFSPIGRILIKNIFGQTIGRIDLAPTNILSGNTRNLTSAYNNKSRGGEFGGPPSSAWTEPAREAVGRGKNETGPLEAIIWPEHFLLGPYTATLNLALSEKGPIYNQSILFFALPIQITISIIITLTILITIIIRIRHKLKKR